MLRQRPGQKVFTIPGPDWGVRVVQPAAPPADWWDPDNEGLSVVGAYRAINSAGTPWGGGPANYAESLVNQANPGVNDLTEGNGAVPWAAATGWGFVAAALQYFDTGVVPTIDGTWTALLQYANHIVVASSYLFGLIDNPALAMLALRTSAGPDRMLPYNGIIAANGNVPGLLTGNYGFAAKQPYRNGAADPNLIPAGVGGATALTIFLGALNVNGAPGGYSTEDIHAFVIYDATLTGPQVLAVATAMAAL